MTRGGDFLLLLDACRRGDPAATAELVRRYLPHIRAAVRRRLDPGMRLRFDTQDFAQDVWLSFFRATIDRTELRDEAALIKYLLEMARLKVAEEYRHQSTLKVALPRQTLLEDDRQPAGRDPTPSAAAIADEQWQSLTAGLSDRERQMLRMLREGYTHADAASALGLSEKTVQRLVRRILGRKPL